jgi:hypothetical protein
MIFIHVAICADDSTDVSWGMIIQGKSEQMMDYIKRLRACIRALQESEASQMSQKEALQNQLQEERQDRNLSGSDIYLYVSWLSSPHAKVCDVFENILMFFH